MYLILSKTFRGEYQSPDEQYIGYIETEEDTIRYLSRYGNIKNYKDGNYQSITSGELFGTQYKAVKLRKIDLDGGVNVS